MKKSLWFAVIPLLGALGFAATVPAAPAPRMISFSGYNWLVKSSAGRIGPGPNYFSDGAQNVFVDALGRLHLKITNSKGKWYCAEIVSQLSFGHGVYRFYLDSPVDNLNPNVVLGLFTWNDDPAFEHREIDIEFSRWGSTNNLNTQYVVQPYTLPQNIIRFNEPAGVAQSVHSFAWSPSQVVFESKIGANPLSTTGIIQQWTFTGNVPQAGGENARMNLWLFQGQRPSNNHEVEVIVRRFEFVAF